MAKEKTTEKPKVHWIMQAKGGVGKSMVAAILLEFLTEKNNGNALGLDTDPNNRSLSDLSDKDNLDVVFLNIMPDSDTVDITKFDDLLMFMIQNERAKDKDLVIDVGATTYQPLYSYIIKNDVFSLLHDFEHFVHIPIAIGAGAEADCLLQLDVMLNTFGSLPTYIVWQNEFFNTKSDHDIEKLEAYQKNKEKIFAVVKMTKRDILFESALEKMTNNKQIFADVNIDPEYNILEKSRLHKIKTDYWDMLDIVIPTQSTKKEGISE
jgi:hypothetical protein